MNTVSYSKTITVEKYQSLYKIIGSFSNSDLYSLWIKVSKFSSWAGIIGGMKLLPEDILLKLEVLDDEIAKVSKKEEEHYRSEVAPSIRKELRKFSEEVKENDPEFVKSRRLKFLKDEIEKLEKAIKVIFEAFKKNGFSFVGDVILKVNDYSERKKKLKRFQFEHYNIEFSNELVLTISEEDVEMARSADCSQFVKVEKRVGGKSWSLCPFHNEKTPSFCSYEDEKGFFCYGCGVGGDAITLVRKLHGLEFKDAVKFINKQ
jgi:DNA primase